MLELFILELEQLQNQIFLCSCFKRNCYRISTFVLILNAKRAAEEEGVDIRLHRIIYKVIEEIESAMKGLLDPEFQEKIIGQAEVRETFKVSKVGTIAGSYVTEGKIARDSGVRVIRDGIVIFEGELDTLKRFKDDAKEVAKGYECGIND